MKKSEKGLIFLLLVSLSVLYACTEGGKPRLFPSPTTSIPTETFTPTPTLTWTPTPTKTITPTPTSTKISAPTITDAPTATLPNTPIPAPFSVMTILPNQDLQFHYKFHGDINQDGSLDGLSVEDFDRYFYLDGCELNTKLTDDYLLVYHEGGQNVSNSIDDCHIRFVKEVSDSFFEKDIKLIMVQFSLSYGTINTDKDERYINYHFYPTSSTVINSEYHESQFMLRFTCQEDWDDLNRYEVVYSNGLSSFYKTVRSYNPIDRFHTIDVPTENWKRIDTELTTNDILGNQGSITKTFVLSFEPSKDPKTVKLFLLPEIVPEITQFDEAIYRWEVDREVNGQGGLNCIYPRPESFGVKLVGAGGIELRIYDIFIITKPGT